MLFRSYYVMALNLYPEAAYEAVFSAVSQGLAWDAGAPQPAGVSVGHSYGGDRARRFVDDLKRIGSTKVDLLVTVDPIDWDVCEFAFVLPGDFCNQSLLKRTSGGINSVSFRQLLGIKKYALDPSPYPLKGYILTTGTEVPAIPKYHDEIDDDVTVHTTIRDTLKTSILLKQVATVSPSVLATSPAATSGSNQTRTFQFSHPSGYSSLNVLNVLVNTAVDGRKACYIAYVQSANTLYLVNDAGDAGGPYAGGLALNGTGSVSNSQCTIVGSGSSAVGSGNTLTLALNMTFNPSFSGNQVVFVAARDTAQNNTGWNTIGVHNVPPYPTTFPNPTGMTPSAGSTSSATVSFVYQDGTNAANLQTSWVLINTALDGRGACYVAYYRPGNQLFLIPDNGDGTQAAGMVLSGTNSLSNSQCTVSAQGSSVSTNGGQLTLNLNVAFKPAFSGPKAAWMAVGTLGGQVSPWRAMGVWQVP